MAMYLLGSLLKCSFFLVIKPRVHLPNSYALVQNGFFKTSNLPFLDMPHIEQGYPLD